jgi:hypothetical protein
MANVKCPECSASLPPSRLLRHRDKEHPCWDDIEPSGPIRRLRWRHVDIVENRWNEHMQVRIGRVVQVRDGIRATSKVKQIIEESGCGTLEDVVAKYGDGSYFMAGPIHEPEDVCPFRNGDELPMHAEPHPAQEQQ